MTDTASHTVPGQGNFRRAFAAVWAFVQAMDSTSLDHTLDRIERLEQEVGQLRKALRQRPDPAPVDARNDSAPA